jgi:hypothetical protein
VRDSAKGDGFKELTCTNKFGDVIHTSGDRKPAGLPSPKIIGVINSMGTPELKKYIRHNLANWSYVTLHDICRRLVEHACPPQADEARARAIEVLTYMNDIRLPSGGKKRSRVLSIVRDSLTRIFNVIPPITAGDRRSAYRHIDWATRASLRAPQGSERVLVLDAGRCSPAGRRRL